MRKWIVVFVLFFSFNAFSFDLSIFFQKPEKVEKDSKKNRKKMPFDVAQIVLSGEFIDYSLNRSIFSTVKEVELAKLIKIINEIINNKNIKKVLIRIKTVYGSIVYIEEMASLIERLKRAGKDVIVYVDSADSFMFGIAVLGSKVYMNPAGEVYMPGFRIDLLYYKNLLEKLGIKASFLRFKNYKTAMENFELDEPSKEQNIMINEILDQAYGGFVKHISKFRHIDEDIVRELIDRGFLKGKELLKYKLIDGFTTYDKLKDKLSKKFNVVQYFPEVKKSKKGSSISEFLKIFFGGGEKKKKEKKAGIGVLFLEGPIIYESLSSSVFKSVSIIEYFSFKKELKKLMESDYIKGIVIRVQSPGGSALASELILQELKKYKNKKPVFVSMGSVAASGGYYISLGVDKIYADSMSITGSIGVLLGKFVIKGLLEKIDVKIYSYSRGKVAGVFSGYKDFSDQEKKSLTRVMQKVYDQFLKRVSDSRNIPFKEVKELAKGRVYVGNRAKKIKLVDKIGSLFDAVSDMQKKLKLKQPNLYFYPEKLSFFDIFSSSFEERISLPDVVNLLKIDPYKFFGGNFFYLLPFYFSMSL